VDAGLLDGKGLMVHLNGATSVGELPDTKHLLTTVETAVGLGADAVSVQVNFRPDNHAHNLGLLGAVVDEAQRFGVPVLAMVYPASPTEDHHAALRLHRHFLRAALELGVSAVKTAPPEDLQDVPVLLEGLGEDLPVLFSGVR
jgi:class I fructose-bisphosphate aldolase/fructose-bisphosphate aldolase/2-amino-3,7-dideoxy-D-threo-hept-6-ulosonate synthase